MNTFLSILNNIWQIIKTIICWLLSVLIFCLSKLKDLFDKKTDKQENLTREELFAWLDDYFSQKDSEKANTDKKAEVEKQGYKINSNFDYLFN